jgi:molybdopterin biosynthesis enzyme MoaB
MSLPEELEVLVITLSDRASKGEYEDLSGPRVNLLVQ